MIFQGGNSPIVLKFPYDISDMSGFSAALIDDRSSCVLKQWNLSDINIDGSMLYMPLSQDDTLSMPHGIHFLEVKWLSGQNIQFAKIIRIHVIKRDDKTSFAAGHGTEATKEITVEAAQPVANFGRSPYVNMQTGTWWEYDDNIHGYRDTGISVAMKVDAELSEASENAIQNRAVAKEFAKTPEWAKQPDKPSYSASDVGALDINDVKIIKAADIDVLWDSI